MGRGVWVPAQGRDDDELVARHCPSAGLRAAEHAV